MFDYSLENKSDDELVDLYKKKGDKNAKKVIMKRYKHLIEQQARLRFGSSTAIPMGAIEAEGLKLLSQAIDSYDKSFGASLSTHFFNYLRKLTRFVNTYGYPVRPSEGVKEKFSVIRDAEFILTERLGRAPSYTEISDFVKMDEGSVRRIKDQLVSVVTQVDDQATGGSGMLDDYIDYVRKFDLTPQEQIVFDYSTGYGGLKQMKAGEIAKKLKMSPAQLSHIKKNVSTKFNQAFQIGDVLRI